MWPRSNVIIAILAGLVHLQGAKGSQCASLLAPTNCWPTSKAWVWLPKAPDVIKCMWKICKSSSGRNFHFCASSSQFNPFVLKISFPWKKGGWKGKDNHSLVPFLLLQSPDTGIPFLKLFWLWWKPVTCWTCSHFKYSYRIMDFLTKWLIFLCLAFSLCMCGNPISSLIKCFLCNFYLKTPNFFCLINFQKKWLRWSLCCSNRHKK